jgi:hypothetical protein
MRGLRHQAVAIGSLALAGGAWAGPEIVEGPGDAGSTPGSAQISTVAGPVTTIRGSLLGFKGIAGKLIGDFEDMYQIYIADPDKFTIDFSDATIPVSLWLFDAKGFGVLGNLASGDGFGPVLPQFATDSSRSGVFEPGFYFVAITSSGRSPFSFDGKFAGPIFDFEDPFEVSGPDGSGGFGPLSFWSGTPNPFSFDEYEITMITGVQGDIPGPATIGALGLAGLLRKRRRTG